MFYAIFVPSNLVIQAESRQSCVALAEMELHNNIESLSKYLVVNQHDFEEIKRRHPNVTFHMLHYKNHIPQQKAQPIVQSHGGPLTFEDDLIEVNEVQEEVKPTYNFSKLADRILRNAKKGKIKFGGKS